jgi:hypothetical protein
MLVPWFFSWRESSVWDPIPQHSGSNFLKCTADMAESNMKDKYAKCNDIRHETESFSLVLGIIRGQNMYINA